MKESILRTGGTGPITLFGRRKDFIITAYGKNISIPKIEQRMKDIPVFPRPCLWAKTVPTALL